MANRAKLLVVDNEIDICNFVKSFFELRGFDVVHALNGDEALKKIAENPPDIVILDVMMRTANEGLDYLPRVKAALPAARIIMITGVNDEDSIAKAKSLGAEDYITKPLILEYLENTVLKKIENLQK